ncbi:hypothetical protein D3C72_2138270 [compost metagenome]
MTPCPVILLAIISFLVFLSESACAFPLPSASASAKLANSSVKRRMRATEMLKPVDTLTPKASGTNSRNKVIRNPASTMNMTGFRSIILGSSLINDCLTA